MFVIAFPALKSKPPILENFPSLEIFPPVTSVIVSLDDIFPDLPRLISLSLVPKSTVNVFSLAIVPEFSKFLSKVSAFPSIKILPPVISPPCGLFLSPLPLLSNPLVTLIVRASSPETFPLISLVNVPVFTTNSPDFNSPSLAALVSLLFFPTFNSPEFVTLSLISSFPLPCTNNLPEFVRVFSPDIFMLPFASIFPSFVILSVAFKLKSVVFIFPSLLLLNVVDSTFNPFSATIDFLLSKEFVFIVVFSFTAKLPVLSNLALLLSFLSTFKLPFIAVLVLFTNPPPSIVRFPVTFTAESLSSSLPNVTFSLSFPTNFICPFPPTFSLLNLAF